MLLYEAARKKGKHNTKNTQPKGMEMHLKIPTVDVVTHDTQSEGAKMPTLDYQEKHNTARIYSLVGIDNTRSHKRQRRVNYPTQFLKKL